jgi:HPt (histidine-containing phosphotransfer) domain-containing protein
MDESSALAGLDGSRELLEELAQIFVEDTPDLLQQLEQAIALDDAQEARRAVHSVKGLAATFFARPTVELAKQLELDASKGDLTTLLNGGLEQLRDLIGRLIEDFHQKGLVR